MANAHQSEPAFKVAVGKDQVMRTRDGVCLRADVYRPDAPGRFPVLLVRTPYDKGAGMALTEKDYFPPRGYVALVQYYAASLRPPHLRVAAPVSGPVSYFENFAYRRGALELGWMLAYFMFMARDTMARKGIYEQHRERLDSYVSRPDIPMAPLKRDAYQHLPVRDWGERLKDGAPYLADYLRHWTDGTYWAATDLRPRFGEFDTPMFHVGSWYDVFQYDTLAMYLGMRDGSRSEQTRRGQKLLMGPWAHLLPYSIPTSRGTGDIDFGPAAAIELHALQLRWFDHFLKGIGNGVLEEPPVRLFVMGENRWRDENEWPLARA